MWWGIGAVMLLMALQGYKIFRKKYNNKIYDVMKKVFNDFIRSLWFGFIWTR